MRRTISLLLFLFVCGVWLGGEEITAQPPSCAIQAQSDTLVLSEFEEIASWHAAGHCGAGQHIGILTTLIHDRTQLSTIVHEWDAEEQNNTASLSRELTDFLIALHRLAPAAEISLYRISGNDTATFAPNFTEGVHWLLNTRQVTMIVNITASPLLELADLTRFNQLQQDAHERNVLWINTSGNYGRSFLRNEFTRGAFGYHKFDILGQRSPQERFLPLRVINPATRTTVYVLWDNTSITFVPEVYDADFQSISVLPPASSPLHHTLIIAEGDLDHDAPFYLAITANREPVDGEEFVFRLYMNNAVLGENINPSLGSLTIPNNDERSLTVGAATMDMEGYTGIISSTSGDKPEIFAPGDYTQTLTSPTSGAATMFVAGVAATMWSAEPSLTSDALIQRLEISVNSQNGVFIITPYQLTPVQVSSDVDSGLLVLVAGVAFALGAAVAVIVIFFPRIRTSSSAKRITQQINRVFKLQLLIWRWIRTHGQLSTVIAIMALILAFIAALPIICDYWGVFCLPSETTISTITDVPPEVMPTSTPEA